MNGFDFGKIGNIVSNIMDTDYIDIKRDTDGSLVEVYSNIPCHIAYVSIDNPDPNTIDIKPIIQGITIHFPLWVDVRNNDYIVAKKIDSSGSMAIAYSGRCGNPVVSMGRKKVLMEMDATEPESPTPIPPENYHEVTISYREVEMDATESSTMIDDNSYLDETNLTTMVYVFVENTDNEIRSSIVETIGDGETFTKSAPSIDGYSPVGSILDGTRSDSTSVTIEDMDSDHDVRFLYEELSVSDTFKFLVKGLYTKDDGSLANGWHTYKSVNIDSISQGEGEYTITCDNVSYEHEDNGKILKIEEGALLILFPRKIFIEVDSLSVTNDKVTFVATQFTPSEEQESYYETKWYE